MEYGTIERVIEVAASPEIVFALVSEPEHLKAWWPDEASFDVREGATGELVFHHEDSSAPYVAKMHVVEVDAPRRFAFRWVYDEGVTPGPENSLLVSFDLARVDAGTRVTMTETGFRERGWALAELEAAYRDHCAGWDYFVPRLGVYVSKVLGVA